MRVAGLAAEEAHLVQHGRTVRRQPVRDGGVAEDVAVSLAVVGQGGTEGVERAEDEYPRDEPAGECPPGPHHGRVRHRPGRLEVAGRLGLQAFRERLGRPHAMLDPPQLGRVRGDTQPGDAQRPGTEDVGEVVHAEGEAGEADRGHQDGRRDDDRGPPPPGQGRRENHEQRAVHDDGAQRMAAGEAVSAAGGDRVRDDRAQPADGRLERRIEDQRTGPGHHEERDQPVPPADEQQHGRDDDQPDQDRVAAQPGDEPEGEDHRPVPGNRSVQGGGHPMVDRLQRYPLQPHEHEQHTEQQRPGTDRGYLQQLPAAQAGGRGGVDRHDRPVPGRASIHTPARVWPHRHSGNPSS